MAAITPTARPAVAFAGIAGLAAGAALIVLLAFIPPTDEISVTRQTISQYGLTDGRWVFNLAVLLVAAGSAVIIGLLWSQGRLPRASIVLGTLWIVSLLVIVAFPKANWAVVTGFNLGGTVHRGASLIGFGCLPFAVLAAARTVFPDSPGRRFAARLFAVLSLAWFGAILVAVVVAAVADLRWWQLIPLGAVERGMALTDLIALTLLALPTVAARVPRETAAVVG
ncbi:MAG TPA: DUF998 domain-containing protein [Pseudonocardiaceae bacterium]|nr:DUF998 domain-containing protein [Pseudonocardiaceae bacterium]